MPLAVGRIMGKVHNIFINLDMLVLFLNIRSMVIWFGIYQKEKFGFYLFIFYFVLLDLVATGWWMGHLMNFFFFFGSFLYQLLLLYMLSKKTKKTIITIYIYIFWFWYQLNVKNLRSRVQILRFRGASK